MPFIGTPVVKEVSERLYRITGVSLEADPDEGGNVGTISLTSGTGQIKLPRTDDWARYRDVTLQDAVQVAITLQPPVNITAIPFTVVKTGSTPDDFLISIANASEGEETPGEDSGPLEIYVSLH